jgi:hypothetical protein
MLVTSDYKLNRAVFTQAIRMLRPAYDVREVVPEEMDAAVRSGRPWLVICSSVTTTIEALVPAWILLPLEGHEQAAVSVHGRRRDLPIPPLEDVLSLIDELWTTVAPQFPR